MFKSVFIGWHTLVIPALGKWRQENLKFEASLGYIPRLRLKKANTKKQKKKTCACMEEWVE
jgi:hypothetical protein